MKPIINRGTISPTWTHRGVGLETLCLSGALGSERIYVNLDRIEPGAFSAKYHSHSRQEEFFYILSGRGVLRFNGEEYSVSAGDAVAKPAGRGLAHQFFNNGDDLLEILDVGTVEAEDICCYPDEGVTLTRNGGEARAERDGQPLPGWSSEPNRDGNKSACGPSN